MTQLSSTHVEVIDNSDGLCDGGAKLELIVVSKKFEGMPLLKRHRLVNNCLSDLMPMIHALSMKTWTPAQYETKNKP